MTFMTRRAFWLFAVCCLIVLGAMGWLTSLTVQLDRQDAAAQRRAEREEDTRLALWRMDSVLAPLVSQETTRPYFHFTAFYPVVGSFTARLTELQDGDVFAPSPLVTYRSPFVHLHFQLDSSGQVSSPQLPTGVMGDTLRRQLGDQFGKVGREADLVRCEQLLKSADLTGRAAAICGDAFQIVSQTRAGVEGQGLAVVCTPVATGGDVNQLLQVQGGTQVPEPTAIPSAAMPTKQTGRGRVVPEQQALRNAAELSQRQKNLNLSSQLSQSATSYLAPSELTRRTVNSVADGNVFATALAWGEVRATPFQWEWVGDELFCVRRVRLNDRESLQGCWLNWGAIEAVLRTEIADLLPNARFRALARRANGELGAASSGVASYALASLPAALDPGEIPATADQLAPTIRHSLWIAWVCAGLAIVAVGSLLRGAMALSERRADFVSAVTHELRTPLTTFRLYLDLLTSGRVSDPQRRQEYLTTLQGESERLGHLVENVLRYARLERGKTPANLESVSAEALLSRCLERLRRRAEQSEVELAVRFTPDDGNVEVRTDPLAVEQILYNLVDNACKYGVGTDRGHVDLEIQRAGDCCTFRVSDEGPGLSPEAQQRLFRPFSKSAERAAQSAAGVGLGLALSRRLARELGGDLRLEPSERGACFVLKLTADAATGRRSGTGGAVRP